jgi:hypothetical protein
MLQYNENQPGSPCQQQVGLEQKLVAVQPDLDGQRQVDFHPELVNFNQNLVTTQPAAGWRLGWNSTLLPTTEL